MQDIKNTIICGNCVDVMSKFPNEFVDLVVTSPPYDKMRDYNNYEFDFKLVADQLYRVVKVGGVVVWIVADSTIKGSETLSSFRHALYFKLIGFNVHSTMIWVKPSGGGARGSNNCYTPNFDYMFVFSKGKPKSINLIYDIPNSTYGQPGKVQHGRRKPNGEVKIELRKPPKEFGRRNTCWYGPTQAGKHPAVFPDWIARDHIISWSSEGDLVLDPMNGSGTTCLAAKLLNRNYIGIDTSDEYCRMAEERLIIS